MDFDSSYSFPFAAPISGPVSGPSVLTAPQTSASMSPKKSRATSMGTLSERPPRRLLHAHKRSGAMSEDLNSLDISALLNSAANSSNTSASVASRSPRRSEQLRGAAFGALPSPNLANRENVDVGPWSPSSPQPLSPRKVAFAEPRSPTAMAARSPSRQPVRKSTVNRGLYEVGREQSPILREPSPVSLGTPVNGTAKGAQPKEKEKEVKQPEIAKDLTDPREHATGSPCRHSRRRSLITIFSRKKRSQSAGASQSVRPVLVAPTQHTGLSPPTRKSTESQHSASSRSSCQASSPRTIELQLPEPPSIDLDEALVSNYSPNLSLKGYHRRSESLPAGLKSPCAFSTAKSMGQAKITPVVEEEESPDFDFSSSSPTRRNHRNLFSDTESPRGWKTMSAPYALDMEPHAGFQLGAEWCANSSPTMAGALGPGLGSMSLKDSLPYPVAHDLSSGLSSVGSPSSSSQYLVSEPSTPMDSFEPGPGPLLGYSQAAPSISSMSTSASTVNQPTNEHRPRKPKGNRWGIVDWVKSRSRAQSTQLP